MERQKGSSNLRSDSVFPSPLRVLSRSWPSRQIAPTQGFAIDLLRDRAPRHYAAAAARGSGDQLSRGSRRFAAGTIARGRAKRAGCGGRWGPKGLGTL